MMFRQVGKKLIIKRIKLKVYFISLRQVSTVNDGFVKQVLHKQWPTSNKMSVNFVFFKQKLTHLVMVYKVHPQK